MIGCWKLEIIPKKFSDYDPDYKNLDDTINHANNPLIVMNHCCLCDGHIDWATGFGPSIVGRTILSKTPFYGSIMRNAQSVFINRKDPVERANVLNTITERTLEAEKTEMAPMLLYPEGTVTHGDVLLTFKKGAFYGLRPMKVICTKYETSGYKPYTCSMRLHDIQLFNFSNFGCKIKVYIFEGLFDPTYLNLDYENKDKSWEIYASKIRSIMSKCLNQPMVDQGFRTSKEYDDVYYKLVKELKVKKYGKRPDKKSAKSKSDKKK